MKKNPLFVAVSNQKGGGRQKYHAGNACQSPELFDGQECGYR